MKFYVKPQAHHWIVLRLIRIHSKINRAYTIDHARSIVWLIREVGSQQLNEMIDALNFEEENK